LVVVIVLLVLVTGCGTGTGSKTSDAVDVTATLHNNNGKVSLHIENTGEKSVSINSFSVMSLEGDILFTDKKYDGWFPLTLNPGGRWEFYDEGGSADVIYRAVVVFSGKRNHSILVEQTDPGCPDVFHQPPIVAAGASVWK